jgi:hypothetical protein
MAAWRALYKDSPGFIRVTCHEHVDAWMGIISIVFYTWDHPGQRDILADTIEASAC